MLTFAEDLMLLLLQQETGHFENVPEASLTYALAGAVLMDLASGHRIRMDDGRITVLDTGPTGNWVQDHVLRLLALDHSHHPDPVHWINVITEDIDSIKKSVLDRLVEQGILQRVNETFLWVIPTERYPTIDYRTEQQIRQRIRNVVLEGAEPDWSESVLISLVKACRLFEILLSPAELKQARERIDSLAAGVPIGRAVEETIRQLNMVLASSLAQL